MTSALLNADALPTQPSALPSIEVLHALYQPRIFRFLLASTRDRDLAETLTQETFLRAWSAQANFRGECSAATWLTRIAHNLLRDHTRTDRFRFWRHAARTSVDAQSLAAYLPSSDSASEQALIAREQLTLIFTTVAQLSERQRTVFLLRYVEEFELADIALATSLPLPTVKTHLYRALAVIRARHTAPTPRSTS